MMQLAKFITPADVKAALKSLDELNNRIALASAIPDWLRGDFSADTVNLLRSEFERLWRMAEINADVDVLYCAPDMLNEIRHTEGNTQ